MLNSALSSPRRGDLLTHYVPSRLLQQRNTAPYKQLCMHTASTMLVSTVPWCVFRLVLCCLQVPLVSTPPQQAGPAQGTPKATPTTRPTAQGNPNSRPQATPPALSTTLEVLIAQTPALLSSTPQAISASLSNAQEGPSTNDAPCAVSSQATPAPKPLPNAKEPLPPNRDPQAALAADPTVQAGSSSSSGHRSAHSQATQPTCPAGGATPASAPASTAVWPDCSTAVIKPFKAQKGLPIPAIWGQSQGARFEPITTGPGRAFELVQVCIFEVCTQCFQHDDSKCSAVLLTML